MRRPGLAHLGPQRGTMGGQGDHVQRKPGNPHDQGRNPRGEAELRSNYELGIQHQLPGGVRPDPQHGGGRPAATGEDDQDRVRLQRHGVRPGFGEPPVGDGLRGHQPQVPGRRVRRRGAADRVLEPAGLALHAGDVDAAWGCDGERVLQELGEALLGERWRGEPGGCHGPGDRRQGVPEASGVRLIH